MTYMYVLYLHSCSSRNLLLVTKKKRSFGSLCCLCVNEVFFPIAPIVPKQLNPPHHTQLLTWTLHFASKLLNSITAVNSTPQFPCVDICWYRRTRIQSTHSQALGWLLHALVSLLTVLPISPLIDLNSLRLSRLLCKEARVTASSFKIAGGETDRTLEESPPVP